MHRRPPADRTLDYTTPAPPAAPLSKLALASFVFAFLGSPCFIGPMMRLACKDVRIANGWFLAVPVAALAVCTSLCVVALQRVRRSGGTRRGAGFAIGGLTVNAVWWLWLIGALILISSHVIG